MRVRRSDLRLAGIIVLILVSEGCSWLRDLPDTHQWPRDELFGKNTSQGDRFWPLPPEPPEDIPKAQFALLKNERKNMIETCTPVLEYFREEKDRAWWKELAIQGSEIGFAAAVIVLAAANPAANAAMIGILGGIGGLEYFTMWPLMQDVVNTENTLMTELRHSRKLYGEAMVEYTQPQAPQPQPAQAQQQTPLIPPMQRMRTAVDKASNACVLSKMQLTIPPPKKPDIQPPIP